jgi:hypothetical protein
VVAVEMKVGSRSRIIGVHFENGRIREILILSQKENIDDLGSKFSWAFIK